MQNGFKLCFVLFCFQQVQVPKNCEREEDKEEEEEEKALSSSQCVPSRCSQ
jgi:hypothetical protein